ncbi:MAG TPA: hypothetical protein VEI82_10765 [Myxococcota bacterium]|nr:hypothetical protein [Myxococcota bacterium]
MATALRALGLSLLLACASPPEARFSEAPIPPGQARLYVYRARQSSGPKDAGTITVNAHPLAVLGRGEYVSVVLPPGTIRLRAGREEAFARVSPEPIELQADRALYCALAADLSASLVLWTFACSSDAGEHAELRACRRGALDRTVDWVP